MVSRFEYKLLIFLISYILIYEIFCSFSDVIIRSHQTHSSEEIGITGLIQLLSVIPKSYPGHSILTEDLGTIYGIDDCKCERKGKYFKVHGRIKSAEIRGCSDTYS